MKPMQTISENMFYPDAFEMGISVAAATGAAVATTPAAASVARQVGSSNLLLYFLIGFILLAAIGVAIYLMTEHQRESRELEGQY